MRLQQSLQLRRSLRSSALSLAYSRCWSAHSDSTEESVVYDGGGLRDHAGLAAEAPVLSTLGGEPGISGARSLEGLATGAMRQASCCDKTVRKSPASIVLIWKHQDVLLLILPARSDCQGDAMRWQEECDLVESHWKCTPECHPATAHNSWNSIRLHQALSMSASQPIAGGVRVYA